MSKHPFINGKFTQSESGKKNANKNGKHVLLIAPQPIYEDRGTPIAVCYTLEALSKLGYSVDLATFPVGLEVVYPGIRVIRTSNPFRFKYVPVGFSFRKVVLDLCLFVTVLRLALRNHYDCVHGVEEGAAIALAMKALLGRPVIYDMQSSIPEKMREYKVLSVGPGIWLCLHFERLLVKYVDSVIVSRGLAPRVLAIDPKKKIMECNFWGYDAQPLNKELAKRLGVFERPTVVYTGTFTSYQGLHHLIRAAAIVKTKLPKVVFLLVGGTQIEITRLAQSVKKYGIEDNVQFFARLPRREIPEYLALADVLVLPNVRGENAPLKLFDYMKSGKPIVATDIPAHRTLLSEETAILVESKIHAIADGILFALTNAVHARGVAQAAMNSARKNETKSFLETIAEAYSLVIAKDAEPTSDHKEYLVAKPPF